MSVSSIQEVLDVLDQIILDAIQGRSRLGYFPALYYRVTANIKTKIDSGQFQNPERLEQLDVIFANRYIEAYENFKQKQPVTDAWNVAFSAAPRWHFLVLQHLILGMNAHINLDLGIATASLAEDGDLSHLQADFMGINSILAEELDNVQDSITRISPLAGVLDRLGGRRDEKVINFSMTKARDASWVVAQRLATLDPEHREVEIRKIDEAVSLLAKRVVSPGKLIGIVALAVRLGEVGDVGTKIAALNQP